MDGVVTMKILMLIAALVVVPSMAHAQALGIGSVVVVNDVTLAQVPADDAAAPRHTKMQARGFWAFGLVQMVDISQSMYLFGQRKAVELNPLLAPLQDRPEAFAAVKWTVAGAGAFAAWNQFERGNRKAGWTILIGGIAANAVVIANNHRLIKTTR